MISPTYPSIRLKKISLKNIFSKKTKFLYQDEDVKITHSKAILKHLGKHDKPIFLKIKKNIFTSS